MPILSAWTLDPLPCFQPQTTDSLREILHRCIQVNVWVELTALPMLCSAVCTLGACYKAALQHELVLNSYVSTQAVLEVVLQIMDDNPCDVLNVFLQPYILSS